VDQWGPAEAQLRRWVWGRWRARRRAGKPPPPAAEQPLREEGGSSGWNRRASKQHQPGHTLL